MKKRLFLMLCVYVCFLCACSIQQETAETSLIDAGRYYSIYKIDLTQVRYNIYNAKGEVIQSKTTDRPLNIEMLNDDIVDIEIGMGTGITIHNYYSVKRDLFSADFPYVVANLNELVAYIDVPKTQSFENRKIVVQNIFESEVFYNEFRLDFSYVDTPVVDAEFSDDGTSLQVSYLSGIEQKIVSATLELNSTA